MRGESRSGDGCGESGSTSVGVGSGTLSGEGEGNDDDVGRVLSGRGAQATRSGAGAQAWLAAR